MQFKNYSISDTVCFFFSGTKGTDPGLLCKRLLVSLKENRKIDVSNVWPSFNSFSKLHTIFTYFTDFWYWFKDINMYVLSPLGVFDNSMFFGSTIN